MSKVILVETDGDSMKVEMSGFKGKACVKKAQQIDEMLKELGIGVKMDEFKAKPELQEVEENVTQTENAD